MPSVSQNQQQLMGMAYAYATGRRKDVPERAKEIAQSFMKGKDTDKKLTKKQKEARKKRGIAKLKDFASTKHKNLPEVLESKVYNFEEYMISMISMKIVNENQLRVIVENEEYINSIKELINTFTENNINTAFLIMKGMRIKQSIILDEYKELFDIFGLKPSKLNLIKMGNSREVYVGIRFSVPKILFKMPNLKEIGIEVKHLANLTSLGNLSSFDGKLSLFTIDDKISSLSNLESVGGYLRLNSTSIKVLDNLKYVGGSLVIVSPIESLPKLEYVGGDLNLENTPLGKKLSETMTEDEIRNKYGVKGNIYL